jgi:hypothetical protein
LATEKAEMKTSRGVCSFFFTPFGGQMKRFGTALLVLLLGASAYAQVTPPPTMKIKVAIGLGFQLCPERKTLPSLESAYLCSGLVATPQTVEVEMQNMKAAKPEWVFYQGSYNTSTTFQDVSITLESLVMSSKVDGKTTAFIDGRLISTRKGVASQPIYFRASAQGGSQNFTYSSTYGTMSPIILTKGTAEFTPYMTIAAPKP